ncbi:MAG: histidinol dehydrogenase, partial [Actinobacteria bacterium]|nr:histidinol dehydrogenase [Actinomycetota bacterium]
ILLTTDKEVADLTVKEIYSQVDSLFGTYKERFKIDDVLSTLKKHCKIIVHSDMDFLVKISNIFAPEHLELMVKDPDKVLPGIKNAGAIFIGDYTPVAAGDYICGTNHIIPTAGNARFSSPLGVYDFYKKSSVAYYSFEALKEEQKHIRVLSDFENLLAHKNSVEVRFKK